MTQNFSTKTQNFSTKTQNFSTNTQNIPTMTQNFPTMTQNFPTMTQNFSTKTQNFSTKTQNLSTNTQNIPTMTQNFPTMTQNFPTMTQNFPTMTQNFSTMSLSKSGGSKYTLPVRKSTIVLDPDEEPSQQLSNVSVKIVNSASGASMAVRTLNEMQEIPSVNHDLRATKLFLQQQGVQNLSIWSHMTNVLNKIISEQPDNIIDYFEEYSRKLKQEQLDEDDNLRDVYVPLPHVESAKNQLQLINSYGIKEEEGEEAAGGEEEEEKAPSNQMDLEEAAFYFREAGIGIPEIDVFTINIAMKKMTEEKNLVKPRFWGKIIGVSSDYFVLECELPDEEYEKRNEADELEEAAEAERLAAEAEAAEAAAAEAAAAEAAAAEAAAAEAEAAAAEETATVETEKVEEEDDEMKPTTILVEDEMKPTTIRVEDEKKATTMRGVTKIGTTIQDEGEKSLMEGEETNENLSTLVDDAEQRGVTFFGDSEQVEGEEVVEEEEEEDPLLPPLPPPKKLLKYKIPPILKPVPKEAIKIPAEKHGEGINRKIYYVSNTPELDWTELPKVTPQQIDVARQIQVYFTGDLKSEILTYPAFPGLEKNYLRAQIARISSATQVSPVGYFKFPGEGGEEEEEEEVAEEEEEGGGEKTKLVENNKFQPIPIKDLIDPSLTSWVHHSRYLLKQGRADWWNPKKADAGEEEAEEEQEEEEEEEEEGKEGGEEKEKGLPLLTPLSEDAQIEESPAWVIRKTRNYNSNMVGAVIRSNVWPGACAIAVGKKCENLYWGWGHKQLPQGFSPAPLPHPEYEYDLGPEVLEIQDPTVEVEQQWRQAHKKKPPPVEGEGEGEEGEEEEEEEEEDDD